MTAQAKFLSELSAVDQQKATEWLPQLSRILRNGFPNWEFVCFVLADVNVIRIGAKHKDWDSWTDDHQYTWDFTFMDWFCRSAVEAMKWEVIQKVTAEMMTRIDSKGDIEFTMVNELPVPEKTLTLETLNHFHEMLDDALNVSLTKAIDEEMMKSLFGGTATEWKGRR